MHDKHFLPWGTRWQHFSSLKVWSPLRFWDHHIGLCGCGGHKGLSWTSLSLSSPALWEPVSHTTLCPPFSPHSYVLAHKCRAAWPLLFVTEKKIIIHVSCSKLCSQVTHLWPAALWDKCVCTGCTTLQLRWTAEERDWPQGLREEQLWLAFFCCCFCLCYSVGLCLVALSLLYRCYELTTGQFVGSLTSDEQPVVVFLKSV